MFHLGGVPHPCSTGTSARGTEPQPNGTYALCMFHLGGVPHPCSTGASVLLLIVYNCFGLIFYNVLLRNKRTSERNPHRMNCCEQNANILPNLAKETRELQHHCLDVTRVTLKPCAALKPKPCCETTSINDALTITCLHAQTAKNKATRRLGA